MDSVDQSEREIIVTRIIDAPRELVYKMWTVPEHLAKWWGPKGFTNPVCETDVRPGGKWRQIMRGPDGQEYPAHSVYIEVEEPARLVYKDDVTFENEGQAKTKLTIHTLVASGEDRNKMMEMGYTVGMGESLDRLEQSLLEV
jgi:uncharacterized protein YndB with AHSA1/START domain